MTAAQAVCGWCGHVHPDECFDCGCIPCPDCDKYHTGECGGAQW